MAVAKRKCKFCGEYTREYIKHPIGVFCSQEHALKHALSESNKKATRDKAKRRKSLEQAQKADKRRIKLDNVPHQLKITQEAFNKLRRLQELKYWQDLGQEPRCFCCNNPLGGDVWCAGHFKTVKSSSYLRFDPLNVHLQRNFSDNVHKSGNIEGQKEGYIRRYGEKRGKEILDYLETAPKSRKFTGEELKEMRTKFYAEIRELEKEVNW